MGALDLPRCNNLGGAAERDRQMVAKLAAMGEARETVEQCRGCSAVIGACAKSAGRCACCGRECR